MKKINDELNIKRASYYIIERILCISPEKDLCLLSTHTFYDNLSDNLIIFILGVMVQLLVADRNTLMLILLKIGRNRSIIVFFPKGYALSPLIASSVYPPCAKFQRDLIHEIFEQKHISAVPIIAC